MNKINILDYKPEELKFEGDDDSEITHLLFNPDGTVAVMYLCDVLNIHECTTVNTNGLGLGFKVVPKKPKFVFPSGVGEAVGKSFKTVGGQKLMCVGDARSYVPKCNEVKFPLIMICNLGDVLMFRKEGAYFMGEESSQLDIVDYWTEGE